LRPAAAKGPENDEIEANEQGFQRANGSLNKKKQRKNGKRKKCDSTRVVFQRPAKARTDAACSCPLCGAKPGEERHSVTDSGFNK